MDPGQMCTSKRPNFKTVFSKTNEIWIFAPLLLPIVNSTTVYVILLLVADKFCQKWNFKSETKNDFDILILKNISKEIE